MRGEEDKDTEYKNVDDGVPSSWKFYQDKVSSILLLRKFETRWSLQLRV